MQSDGKKASYNPAATLASLLGKREKLQEELHNIEKQVYELETSYLQESSHFGNALKGFDGFLSASKNTTNLKRSRKFQPEDRIFSLSSVTSPAAEEQGVGRAPYKPSRNSVLMWLRQNHSSEMANLRRALLNISRILDSTAIPARITNFNPPIQSATLYRPLVGSFSRFCSSNQSADIDLSNEESKRRLFNRLLYRSKQRGFLELDLILGKWVEEHIHSMDQNGIKSLVDVLDLENPDLWKWLTSQEQPPEIITTNPVFSALHEKVMNSLDSYAAPETRAIPGQQWVRGWDDFKKGKDSPISGNQ